MMPLRSTSVILFSATLLLGSGWNYQDTKQPVAHITKVVGVVEVRSSSTAAWHLASTKTRLTAGLELRTKQSSLALVAFSDSSKLLVRERSSIRIVCENPKSTKCGILVNQGTIGFDTKSSSEFELDSPYAFAILHGGTGSVSYDSKTRVAVYTVGKGTAEITGKQKDCKLTVTAGHSATIDSVGCRVN
jgi:hypothetical protein